jgi:hypothetical protein
MARGHFISSNYPTNILTIEVKDTFLETGVIVVNSYKRLALAISINTVIMFLLTYVMINNIDDFRVNINNIYMALIMAAPMVIVMLLVMNPMFKKKNLNNLIFITFGTLIIILFFLIRTQSLIGNEQLLRAMTPHHSEAILVCENASITDPDIIELCNEIIQTQREEIAQMNAILERYR